MSEDEAIRRAAALVRTSRRPTVLTGAGMSAESGIPTFREAQTGLWAQFDPHDLATPHAFMHNPKRVWDWYEYRRELMRPAQPNAGHTALAQLERRFPDLPIITQNVDELHEQAGSTNVIHLHGLIAQNKCFYNCQGDPTLIDITTLHWDPQHGPPSCPICGRWVRPNVVWFGEMLPPDRLRAAQDALDQCDVLLVIGTSGVVVPAADMPRVVKGRGGTVIEINPVESTITPLADVWVAASAAVALPQIVAQVG